MPPHRTIVHVAKGDRVRGGLTRLARLAMPAASTPSGSAFESGEAVT